MLEKTSLDAAIPGLTSLLIDLQANPADFVDLDGMAAKVGYSPFHFHRRFSHVVGETPREHMDRVRLELAAYKVAVTNEAMIQIGLSVGFSGPDTFARAFRRRFGMSPREWRRQARVGQRARLDRNIEFRGDGCSLSDVVFAPLPATPLLALRRIGPYNSLDLPYSKGDTLWPRLLRQANAERAAIGGLPILIPLDDPTLTPPEMQHAELCLPVANHAQGAEVVRRIDRAAGIYARVEHRGSSHTIIQAYRAVADGIRRRGYGFGGHPFQVFRCWEHGDEAISGITEVYFPVKTSQ